MALFQRGELRRAALAFEAEVQQRPENAEAWRMLGTWTCMYLCHVCVVDRFPRWLTKCMMQG